MHQNTYSKTSEKYTFQRKVDRGVIMNTDPQMNITKKVNISKPIQFQFSDQKITVKIGLSCTDEICWLQVSGHSWQNVLLSLVLISRKERLFVEHVIETLSFFFSTEDLVQIYEGNSNIQSAHL